MSTEFTLIPDDVTRDLQTAGKKDQIFTAYHHSIKTCIWKFSQLRALQTQKLDYDLLCSLTFMFFLLFSQGICL